MAQTKFDDRFVVGALQGALPLLIWAAHFFVAYMTIKAACELELQRFTLAGFSAITLALWLLSAIAISALVALLVVEGREAKRHFEGGGTLPIVQIGATIFALAAVVWATVPMVLVPPCANLSQYVATSHHAVSDMVLGSVNPPRPGPSFNVQVPLNTRASGPASAVRNGLQLASISSMPLSELGLSALCR